MQVEAARGDMLVLSEVFYPGWRAWVNEREVEILRANYLFRAVPLTEGTQRVRLLYDPLSFKIGLGVFGITVVMLCGWLLLSCQQLFQLLKERALGH